MAKKATASKKPLAPYMALTTGVAATDAYKAAIRAIVENPKDAAEHAKAAGEACTAALIKVAKTLKAPAKKADGDDKPAKGKKKAAAKAEKPAKAEKAEKAAPKKGGKAKAKAKKK